MYSKLILFAGLTQLQTFPAYVKNLRTECKDVTGWQKDWQFTDYSFSFIIDP